MILTASLPLRDFLVKLHRKLRNFPPPLLNQDKRELFVAMTLIYLFYFWEGSWSIRFFTGELQHPLWIGSILLVPAGVLLHRFYTEGWCGPARLFTTPLRRQMSQWFILTILLTLFVATKPAPRYYEIPLLMFTVLLTLALADLNSSLRAGLLAILTFTGMGAYFNNYLLPIRAGQVVHRSFQYSIFKDSTDDTLPKQRLAQALGHRGCPFSQVRSHDPRLMESLTFLAWDDWPLVSRECPYSGEIWADERWPHGNWAGEI